MKRLLRFARNDMIEKFRIQLGTNEFLLQHYQNKINCHAVCQLADGTTALFGADFCNKNELALD